MAYDELYHWGIKGQKWGVRRYRNEDGTLTEAGRDRYYKRENAKSKIKNLLGTRSTSTLKEARSKNVEEMSNQELQDYVNRLNLERNYRSLTKKDLMKGNKIAKDILAYYGTAMAFYTAYKTVKKIAKGG